MYGRTYAFLCHPAIRIFIHRGSENPDLPHPRMSLQNYDVQQKHTMSHWLVGSPGSQVPHPLTLFLFFSELYTNTMCNKPPNPLPHSTLLIGPLLYLPFSRAYPHSPSLCEKIIDLDVWAVIMLILRRATKVRDRRCDWLFAQIKSGYSPGLNVKTPDRANGMTCLSQ